MEKYVVDLWAKVSFGASGAPTLDTNNDSKGIASITRNDTGSYTLVLQDNYYRFLGANCVFDAGADGPAAPTMSVVPDVANGELDLLFQNGGDDTDPADGEVVYIQLSLSNSSAL